MHVCLWMYIVNLLVGWIAYVVCLTEQLNCTRAWTSQLMSDVKSGESGSGNGRGKWGTTSQCSGGIRMRFDQRSESFMSCSVVDWSRVQSVTVCAPAACNFSTATSPASARNGRLGPTTNELLLQWSACMRLTLSAVMRMTDRETYSNTIILYFNSWPHLRLSRATCTSRWSPLAPASCAGYRVKIERSHWLRGCQ